MSDIKRRVVPKSASYTITPGNDRDDTIFTTRGAAGAVTFTLPPPGRGALGRRYGFRNVVDQNMLVAGAAAGDLVTFNDLAANSVAAQTAGQKIGASMTAECIETVSGTFKWLVTGDTVGVTYTVAT